MSETISRQPQGIPAGGQFAPTAHAEPAVSLAPAPPKKDQEWHDAATALEEGGRTPDGARAGVTFVLASHLTSTYLESGKAALADGHETHAAMFIIAHSSLQNLPRKIHAAGDDLAEVRVALSDTRGLLRRSGSMLDMVHPSGRQPVFRNADDVLVRFEDFLSPNTEGNAS